MSLSMINNDNLVSFQKFYCDDSVNEWKDRSTRAKEVAIEILITNYPKFAFKEDYCLQCIERSNLLLEIIVVFEKIYDADLIKAVKKIVATHQSIFYRSLEIKTLEGEGLVYFTPQCGDPSFIPSRGLNAEMLIGSEMVASRYFDCFLTELKSEKFGKMAFKKLSLANKQAHSELLNLLDKEVVIYKGDVEEGFQPDLIGAIENEIDFFTLKYIKKHNLSNEECVEIPKSHIERLDFLSVKDLKKMDVQSWDTLKSVYRYALYIQSVCQERYKNGNLSTIEINEDGVSKLMAETVKNFLES